MDSSEIFNYLNAFDVAGVLEPPCKRTFNLFD